ncbi:EF-P lysine aminoacylase EpmA [Pleionea sediminis]|uniref:EF-P lysine aminoacylase EpmA n=1 Tax=Pleionea sediminis TaxID=2569479 RepID=UPI00118688A3|nr:EF-P lysine aminoacylase EpmA [Pleionea sediminis]
MSGWRPSASIETLKFRSNVFRIVRDFFYQRGVMEVDTPALMPHSVTDPYMDALSVEVCGQKAWLQTSPEYAMKRLIAAGSGDIYQMSKSYRRDERGRNHQPEFMMLEWYRLGWDHHQLMNEVYELVAKVTGINQREMFTYQEAFIKYLSIDPFSSSIEDLEHIAREQLGDLPNDLYRDDYLTLLFAQKIEPVLGKNSIVFIYDFPTTQSSLARLVSVSNSAKSEMRAARFETYCHGIELANGFWELTDVQEQKQRFEKDNKMRNEMGKTLVDIDEKFILALEHGLPNCSGVALGLDRLVMIADKKPHINDVIPFPL